MTRDALQVGWSRLTARLGSLGLAILFATALAQPLQFLDLVYLDYSSGDEGVLLAGAMRILHGQVPYRDFFFFQAPGPLYMIAAWLHVFGHTLVSARWLAWLVNALLVLGLCGLARALKLSRSSLALLLLAQLASGFANWPILNHHWMVNAFLALSAALLAASDRGELRGRLFGAGIMAGMAGLMLQDEGGYWTLLVVLLLILSGGQARWPKIGLFAFGELVVAGPMMAYLMTRASLASVLDSIIFIPLRLYHAIPANRVSWGQDWLVPFQRARDLLSSGQGRWLAVSTLGQGLGMVVVLAAYPVVAVLAIRRMATFRVLTAGQRWQWLVLMCMSGALLLMALHRPTILNLGLALPGPLLVILWEMERWRERHRSWVSITAALLLAVPLASAAFLYSLPFPYIGVRATFPLPCGPLTSEVRKEQPSWQMLRQFMETSCKPGDTLFCYYYSSFYYFVLNIPNPTRYDNFDVGRHDPSMTQGLLAELDAKPPDWILLGGRNSGADGDPVVTWVIKRYKPFGQTNGLLIVKRNDGVGGQGGGDSQDKGLNSPGPILN